MTLQKSSKRFVISTETENSKKLRVRTAGIDTTQYARNPVMLWMHERPKGKSRDEILPLGNCLDVAVENSELYGTPAFDTTDTFAVTLSNKVENGTIRMASAGLKPVEWALDASGDLWLEKSVLVEVSLCDIGSNPDTLAVALYDEDENRITLSDDFVKALTPTLQNPNTDMEIIKLTGAELLVKLKLDQNATSAQFQTAVNNLVTLAETQAAEIQTLTSAKEAAEKAKEAAEKAKEEAVKLTNETRLVTLHDEVVTRERKMTEDAWLELKEAMPYEKLKAYTDKLTPNPTAKDTLANATESQKTQRDEWMKLSYDELNTKELLGKVKKEAEDIFQLKYKDKFGKEYGA